jgi:hypothetical protein
MTPTPSYFFEFVFLYLLNNVSYGFEILQVTETLQLECGKNSLELFCEILNFQIFEIQNKFLKITYLRSKILYIFPTLYLKMFERIVNFQIHMLYVRGTKKRSCLRWKKRVNTNLDASMYDIDRGVCR